MSETSFAREQAIYELLTRDRQTMHKIGANAKLDPALQRLALILGDQQPDYTWATVTSNEWTAKAGTLHVLAGDAVYSTPYGRTTGSHTVKVEPLALLDLDIEAHMAEQNSRIPGGVDEVTATLNRDSGREPIKLKAQTGPDDSSVQALLGLVRTLTGKLA